MKPITSTADDVVKPSRKRRNLSLWAICLASAAILAFIAALQRVGSKPAQPHFETAAPKSVQVYSNLISSIAYSPDGKTLAVCGYLYYPRPSRVSYGDIYLFDATTLERQKVIRRNGSHVENVTFSPDGTLLAYDDRYRKTTTLFDVAKERSIAEFPRQALANTSLKFANKCFSADGKLLSLNGTKTRSRWDISTAPAKQIEVRPLSVQQRGTESLTSPDGKLQIRLEPFPPTRMEDSPDGKRIDRGQQLKVYEARTDKLLYTAPGDMYFTAAFGPGPDKITGVARITDGGANLALVIETIDLQAGTSEQVLVGKDDRLNYQIAISPDGRLVAAADFDNKIFLYDSRTGETLNIWETNKVSKQPTANIWRLLFTSDGRELMSVRAATLEFYDATAFYKQP